MKTEDRSKGEAGRFGDAQVSGQGFCFLIGFCSLLIEQELASQHHQAVPCLSETESLQLAPEFRTLESKSLPEQKKVIIFFFFFNLKYTFW